MSSSEPSTERKILYSIPKDEILSFPATNLQADQPSLENPPQIM